MMEAAGEITCVINHQMGDIWPRSGKFLRILRHKSMKSLRKLISDVKKSKFFRLRRAMVQNIDYNVYFADQNPSYFGPSDTPFKYPPPPCFGGRKQEIPGNPAQNPPQNHENPTKIFALTRD